MTDRIVLSRMEFEGRHGVGDDERADSQVIELDVELLLDARPAGLADDLALTVSYSDIFELCRQIVEERTFRLLEAIAETTAAALLDGFPRVESVVIRVRKPGVPIDGVLDYAGVEIERARTAS